MASKEGTKGKRRLVDSVSSGADTVVVLSDGDVLAGKYRVVGESSYGGMAVVYKAVDQHLDDMPVALKLLPPVISRDKASIARLKREAARCMDLRHDNIVTTMAFVQDGDLAFIVMEYLEGESLDVMLAERGEGFDLDFVLDVARQAVAGLSYVHSKGLVHRDVKPGNLRFGLDHGKRVLKVLNFGIAFDIGASLGRLSKDMQSMSLTYASPEKLKSKRLDARSDQYSLAVTLYELLKGTPPFRGTSLEYQVINSEPEAIDGLPSHVNTALLKALSKSPDRRFEDCESFLRVLEGGFPADEPASARDDIGEVSAVSAGATDAVGVDPGTERVFDGMRFVWIPPGEFWMGSPDDEPGRYDDEGPVHKVRISKGFWLGKYAVTQAEWKAVMSNNPSYFKGDRRPVEQVSWYSCQEFIRRLNTEAGGDYYRLPTEAEWEYACRAGTGTALYDGPIAILDDNNAPALDSIAWYGGNSDGETHPVGLKSPNVWGLHDMLGNVYEWCEDWYDDGYYEKCFYRVEYGENGCVTGPVNNDEAWQRVCRGGYWGLNARFCRCAYRDGDEPGSASYGLGIRLVRSTAPASK